MTNKFSARIIGMLILVALIPSLGACAKGTDGQFNGEVRLIEEAQEHLSQPGDQITPEPAPIEHTSLTPFAVDSSEVPWLLIDTPDGLQLIDALGRA